MTEPLVHVRREGEFAWSCLPLELTPDNYSETFRTVILPLVRPGWDSDCLGFSHLDDGITNKLVAVYPKDRKLEEGTILLRLNGAGTDKIIDRQMEIFVMLALNKAGLIPPVHFVLRNGMCYGFAPGRHLEVGEMSDARMMRRLSRTLSRLHGVELPSLFGEKPQLWAKIESWLEIVPSEFGDPAKQEW